MGERRHTRALSAFVICAVIPMFGCMSRVYYIGITEGNWDYAPTGKNLINGRDVVDDQDSAEYLLRGPTRIGSVYKKAIYRQYTDSSYTQEIPKPDWLGYLGPILKAEVDDVLEIHLKNFGSRAYSIHPHGVFYSKDSEGALYPDRTFDKLKLDDGVPPGGNYTYYWALRPEYAPTEGDANCLTWAYHSHVVAPRDIYSGLIGGILTCKTGILKWSGADQTEVRRTDVAEDFLLMFTVVDENMSWYLDENIQMFCSDAQSVDPDDEAFIESNKMHAINGYMFGNLPNLNLCHERNTSWHLIGMGNEVDVHSVFFHGNTMLNRGHRVDVLSLFPATFVTAEMVPTTTGRWLLSCQVNDHLKAGMDVFYQVLSCDSGAWGTVVPPSGRTRQYFIAAERTEWSYAPQGVDENGVTLTQDPRSEVYFGKGQGRLGGRYLKVTYVEYTNESFSAVRRHSGADEHLGILGPVIRAEIGDVIQVTFKNMADRNYSIQPHGLQYDKQYEGTPYQDGTQKFGSEVSPGGTFTYRWRVTDSPSDSDPPCISYLYYSGTDPPHDTNSGLFGPLLVCKRGALDDHGHQRGADRELFLLFSVFDENLSWYLGENIERFGTNESNPNDEKFQESNKMHAVNGYMYGNLPGLDMCVGDRVVWHILGMGTEVDIHGVYFQGNTFQREGMTRDVASIFPHTMTTVSMQPDSIGTFQVSCLVSDHYKSGMRQRYSVKRCSNRDVPRLAPPGSVVLVQYFISAEELEWDYSPSRTWELQNYNTTAENSPGNIFVGSGPNQIGSRYKKVVYREYTDATFTVQKSRQCDEEHLGFLGPIIRAEVGNQVLVTFKNKASRPYSIHAHGVKTNEDHMTPVQPGQMKQYRWDIPERSGPGNSDPNCILFTYYSTVDFVKDMFSGLLGPLVICRKGKLNRADWRSPVDHEFFLLFMITDESQSWYLDENIRTYLNRDPETVVMDADFKESNMMHGINGRMYANLKGLNMVEGERVDWYLMAMGNEVDIHTAHFHAETFVYKTDLFHRADVYDLIPGSFQIVEMVVGNVGTWLLHCHLADHIQAGMETTFTVLHRTANAGRRGSSASLTGCLALGLVVSALL